MLKILPSGRFRKDYATMKRRGKDMAKLATIIDQLTGLEPLESKHRDHALSGTWARFRDCHVEPDWILIYRIERETLYLERTGTHSDLFK